MQNHANKEIAQMNNAFNEKMFDKQIAYNKEMYQTQLGDQWKFYDDQKANAWKLYEDNKAYQTEMWNKTNEYNDPSAQRERLEAAGLNPYMMMNGGSAGVAGSVSGTQGSAPSAGSPSVQGVQPPTATPYSADYSGIMQGLGTAIDTLMNSSERSVKNAEANNLRIEGKYIASKAIAELYKSYNEAKNDDERVAIQRVLSSIQKDLSASQIAVNNENVRQIQAQTKIAVTENLLREQELKFLPQAQKLQLAQAAADIALKYAQKNLTDQQARHEIEKIAETAARTSLINQQYWTERANTVNAQLENTSRQMENQFQSETYKNRVRLVKESIFDAIYNTDKIGIFKTGARFLQSLGIPSGIE
nr:MAG TPA: DNA pilot protein VP2 [Microviridae sp.]